MPPAIPVPRQAGWNRGLSLPDNRGEALPGQVALSRPGQDRPININQGQPVDLPGGTAFGGAVNASDPDIQAIANATKQTGSCGSCHIGEAASKAGQVLNFNVGGEGRGYTDENGNSSPAAEPRRF